LKIITHEEVKFQTNSIVGIPECITFTLI